MEYLPCGWSYSQCVSVNMNLLHRDAFVRGGNSKTQCLILVDWNDWAEWLCASATHSHMKRDYVHHGECFVCVRDCICMYEQGTCIYNRYQKLV